MILCPVCSEEAAECEATCAEYHPVYKGKKFQAMKLTRITYTHRRDGLVKRCDHNFARPIVLKYQPLSEAQPLILQPG